jgi:hypothetical protein
MAHCEIWYERNGEPGSCNIVTAEPELDDRDVVDALLKVLHPEELAPFGLITDKIRGERPEPQPTCVEVLSQYGISQVRYSVDSQSENTIVR